MPRTLDGPAALVIVGSRSAIAFATGSEGSCVRSTTRIGVFPAWEENPYLNYLYLAARARGYETLHTTTYAGAVATLSRLEPGEVFHIHWTAPIVQRADDAITAQDRLQGFTQAVDAAKERGVVVVWTIHNVLPHDARHVEVEVQLCQMLADRADVIHVLTPATPALTAGHYVLPPGKVRHVPHPSYQGVYASSMEREEARASFGLAETDRAVLFFGQMRPYKGLDNLFAAMDRLDDQHAGRTVLLLAGRTRPEDALEVERTLPRRVRLVRDHTFIDDADVARWFQAADIAVYPYRAILNSGSLHLAATFGIPALLPAEGHLVDEFGDEDWIQFYDPADPVRDIARSLSGALPVPTTSGIFSRRLSPWRVSSTFADLLDQHSGRRAVAESDGAMLV